MAFQPVARSEGSTKCRRHPRNTVDVVAAVTGMVLSFSAALGPESPLAYALVTALRNGFEHGIALAIAVSRMIRLMRANPNKGARNHVYWQLHA